MNAELRNTMFALWENGSATRCTFLKLRSNRPQIGENGIIEGLVQVF